MDGIVDGIKYKRYNSDRFKDGIEIEIGYKQIYKCGWTWTRQMNLENKGINKISSTEISEQNGRPFR